jgi:hypothetical protein
MSFAYVKRLTSGDEGVSISNRNDFDLKFFCRIFRQIHIFKKNTKPYQVRNGFICI